MSHPTTDQSVRSGTASAVATKGGRITFVIGGILFVLSAIVAFAQTPLNPLFTVIYQGLDGEVYAIYGVVMQFGAGTLAGAAMIVFAIGARSGGSVVARKPLGMIALIVFAVWPYVTMIIWALVPYDTMIGLPGWVSIALSLISVVAGLIAVIEIVRIGAVPGVWRWLPAIAYLFVVGPVALVQLAQQFGWNNGEAYAPIVSIPYGIFLFGTFIIPFVLGVAALGLAIAARSRTVAAAPRPGDERVSARSAAAGGHD